ncbi:S8 family serine peptidase [Ectopseudomonas mendocina]|uniref:S8 family serine peptidase n=1 Tax=Ectopseudomonas mendocina TaxID=300 RepID=A0ABZ2RGW2_ECTME
MRLNTLALAITAALTTGVGALAQADESCKLLSVADQVDISRGSPERCLPGVNPLQNQQWHLLNNGQDAFSASVGVSGIDLNLWWAHRLGVLGQGINVAVVDDGIEILHPDLAENIRPGSKNFLNDSNDPTPALSAKGDSHGTSIAGIIAAVDNEIGVKGIAPKVKLQGFNYLKSQNAKNFLYSMGGSDASKDNRVFNQSFALTPINNTNGIDLANDLSEILFERKTLSADSSAVYVKSAGNGFLRFPYEDYTYSRSSQYAQPQLPFANSIAEHSRNNFWNMIISAVNANGTRSSYSSVGSNIFLSAPGGENGTEKPAIVTTDLTGCDMGSNRAEFASSNRLHHGAAQDPNCNYRGTMNGTSAAAPNASASAALLLSAFPELKAGDVRDVLARSATRIDPDHPSAVINVGQRQVVIFEGWEKNAAGLWFSPTYGFGLIDVNAALKLAANHKPLPPLVKLPWQKVTLNDTAQAAIPDVGNQPHQVLLSKNRSRLKVYRCC